MDGKHPLPTKFDTEDGLPSRYYGYSAGRWEGDHTLVIDTVGVSADTWVDKAGYAHTVDMKAEERYERIDHNHLMATITVSDPKVFTRNPFVLARNEYRWIPDQEPEEQLCVPSEMINYMKIIGNPSSALRGNCRTRQRHLVSSHRTPSPTDRTAPESSAILDPVDQSARGNYEGLGDFQQLCLTNGNSDRNACQRLSSRCNASTDTYID
jgi:hypothetical protein